jgi:hypothetical protein
MKWRSWATEVHRRTRVKLEVLFVPCGPSATIVCWPFFPDRLTRGMVPPQLKVPSWATVVVHRTVLAFLRDRNPLMYVTVTTPPGAKWSPLAVIAAFLLPDFGVVLSCGGDDAGDSGGGATGVTVSAAVPEMGVEASVAVIVVAPSATAVARPWEPEAFEMVAVLGEDEDHVTASVRSWLLESE